MNTLTIEQTPEVISDIIFKEIPEDIIIITDLKSDFYVIDKSLPNELVIMEGKSVILTLDSIMDNLSKEESHTIYSASNWEVVIWLFNKHF